MNLGPKCVFLVGLFLCVQAVCADERPRTASNPASDLTFEELKATRERPLFTPNRRPPAPPAAFIASAQTPPSPPAAPPQVSLLGVLVDAVGPRAIIRADGQGGQGKNKAVRIGDDIQGWRVTRIEKQQIVISLDDRDFNVNLFGTEHGAVSVSAVHPPDRALDINSAGVLQFNRIHPND